MIIWDYAQLLAQARAVEATIADLVGMADLLPAFKAGTQADDPYTRRAWAECGPEAARRKFGDCKQVNELQALAAQDLENIEKE
jgi:hypothetical protein